MLRSSVKMVMGRMMSVTSIDMSIETFYDVAVDADYVIHNGSAVYQRTDLVAEMIEEDPADLKYLQKLE